MFNCRITCIFSSLFLQIPTKIYVDEKRNENAAHVCWYSEAPFFRLIKSKLNGWENEFEIFGRKGSAHLRKSCVKVPIDHHPTG